MIIELAPMEGLTGYINRNALAHNFGGIDIFYTPFIPAAKKMSKKIKADLDPENNKGIKLIPQIMSNRVDEVLYLGEQLKEYGYNTLNVNLGCPSGTVTSKKRGSGFLTVPDELDRFLDELYCKADITITLKTRIGFETDDEWPRLLEIYSKYPIPKLIIHPRVRKDFYKNSPRLEAFQMALDKIDTRVTNLSYNGDIVDLDSFHQVQESFPDLDTFMIGRGLFAFPGLAAAIKADTAMPFDKEDYRRRIMSFHDEIFEQYKEIMSGDRDVLFRMKEIWTYLRNNFEDSDKLWKKIKKAQNLAEYKLAISSLR